MTERAFTIVVTGSREAEVHHTPLITDSLMEVAAGRGYPVTLIHGGARGADLICEQVGRMLGWHVVKHEADWATHGKAAGPIRNQQMLDIGKPDVVVAFPRSTSENRGTSDMMQRAREAKVHMVVVMLP